MAQEDEIAACQWMDVEEVLQQPLYSDGIFKVMMDSAIEASAGGGFLGLSFKVRLGILYTTMC